MALAAMVLSCEEEIPRGAFAAVSALRGTAGVMGSQCRWPIGGVRDPDFHFCSADAIKGSCYCAVHYRLNQRSDYVHGTPKKV